MSDSTLHIQLAPVDFGWQKLDRIATIEGELLRPGIYTGIDKATINYSKDVIIEAADSILGQPIKFTHADGADAVVGFWTHRHVSPEAILRVKGVIFDPYVIEMLPVKKFGLSMEADVEAGPPMASLGDAQDARRAHFTAGAMVEHPACKSCWVDHAKEVKLEENRKMGMTTDELVEQAKQNFFDELESALKAAGVCDEDMPKAMKVLRAKIKVPYPSAYPKPKSESSEEALLSAYTEFMKKCMKEGKSMSDCAAEFKKQQGGELPEGLAALQEKALEMETELTKLRAAQDAALDADIAGLVKEIKTADPTFDEKPLLAQTNCKKMQKAMLESVAGAVKKVTKIQLQVGDPNKTQEAYDKVAKQMFGKTYAELMKEGT